MIDVGIEILPGGLAPKKAHPNDAGWDLYSRYQVTDEYHQGQRMTEGLVLKVPLGIRLDIPKGWAAQIVPRSGSTMRNDYIVHTGTIDESYTGEICALITLKNRGMITEGERVAQLIFIPVPRISWKMNFPEKPGRGNAGFGSSGL